MDKLQKKIIRKEYDERHPEMGIVCWQSGEQKWIATSKDIKADYNTTSFQLKMGSWPNKEMQGAYNKNPQSFKWLVLKNLEYKDNEEKNFDEELELLYMLCIDEYPQAKQMRVGRK